MRSFKSLTNIKILDLVKYIRNEKIAKSNLERVGITAIPKISHISEKYEKI